MGIYLVVAGGIFWLLTYLEIIRKGFKDKAYGMPVPALLINFSWEFIFSFVYPPDNAQLYINYLWLLFDIIIFYQLLCYWKNDFNKIPHSFFYFSLFSLMILAYLFVIVNVKEFGGLMGCFYTAYGNNLLMSVLFVAMLFRRKSLAGQSISIASFKLIGTFITSIGYYKYEQAVTSSVLLKYLFVLILIFDTLYLSLLYLQSKKQILFPVQQNS